MSFSPFASYLNSGRSRRSVYSRGWSILLIDDFFKNRFIQGDGLFLKERSFQAFTASVDVLKDRPLYSLLLFMYNLREISHLGAIFRLISRALFKKRLHSIL